MASEERVEQTPRPTGMHLVSRIGLEKIGGPAPKIERALQLNFVGDWGLANLHRICGWLTQEICDRAGRNSTVATHSLYDGGLASIIDVFEGRKDLCIQTPTGLCAAAVTGEGLFKERGKGPMPSLRALGTLPQRDRMLFAVHPKYKVKTWADIHRTKPPLRIAMSTNDGTSFIGFLGVKFLHAHGLTEELLTSWGGAFVYGGWRPEQCTDVVVSGEADCLIQEAIMTPWWTNLIQKEILLPIPAEMNALEQLQAEVGLGPATIRAGFWDKVPDETFTIDFSDFVLIVRDDMPDDVAYLIAWILVNTRTVLESRYNHLPSERSPITWPLQPTAMAKTALPLHPGARKFYEKAGLIP